MNGEIPNTGGADLSQGLGPAAGSSIEKGGQSGGKGPLIGTVIVVILLIAGGVFFLADRMKKTNTELPPDAATLELQNQSTSTDISAIETDINSTDLNGLDQELNSIETELAQ
jgi:hypothetical protein